MQRRGQRDAQRRKATTITSIVGAVAVVVVVVLTVVLLNSGSTPKKKPVAKASPSATASSTPSIPASASGSPLSPSASPSPSTLPLGTCDFQAAGTPAKQVTTPPNTAPTTGTATATVTTTQGTLTFAFKRDSAPCAVSSFISLAQQGYYNNTSCTRITDSDDAYVLQCGDPTGDGTGSPGYTFNDELTGKEQYTAGVLAMANSGPDTNGSQFFIVYKDSKFAPSYTIFGTVTAGLDVVAKVAAKGNDGSNAAGGGKPKLPISINSVTVHD
jgi:peptidyl-prolyl cis-trans isomerase B (cyclophilin B)